MFAVQKDKAIERIILQAIAEGSEIANSESQRYVRLMKAVLNGKYPTELVSDTESALKLDRLAGRCHKILRNKVTEAGTTESELKEIVEKVKSACRQYVNSDGSFNYKGFEQRKRMLTKSLPPHQIKAVEKLAGLSLSGDTVEKKAAPRRKRKKPVAKPPVKLDRPNMHSSIEITNRMMDVLKRNHKIVYCDYPSSNHPSRDVTSNIPVQPKKIEADSLPNFFFELD